LAFLYELAVLGSPSDEQITALTKLLSEAVEPLGLRLGQEVEFLVCPPDFNPEQHKSAAALFFCSSVAPLGNLSTLLRNAVPVVPVVSEGGKSQEELPEALRAFNYLAYDIAGAPRAASALLECAGLLPRQRRVFVSYRRDEARQAALQLFDAFASRVFDVFLDTHGIAPGDDFQSVLWHRLCDSDVLVMLDTPTYFRSRWTSAEFGRALAKNIAVLRIGWPDSTPSARTATASRVELLASEVDSTNGRLADDAVERICQQLESARSRGLAVRHLNLVGNLQYAIEKIGGRVIGVGLNKAVQISLADNRRVIVYPSVGVPTSLTLHDASVNTGSGLVAVVYDHVGLNPSWLAHLDWLAKHVSSVRWVKVSDAAWQFADWE